MKDVAQASNMATFSPEIVSCHLLGRPDDYVSRQA